MLQLASDLNQVFMSSDRSSLCSHASLKTHFFIHAVNRYNIVNANCVFSRNIFHICRNLHTSPDVLVRFKHTLYIFPPSTCLFCLEIFEPRGSLSPPPKPLLYLIFCIFFLIGLFCLFLTLPL